MTEADILTRLRRNPRRSKLLDEAIDEIIALTSAAAAAQKAADQWQARAERAERELDRYRRNDPRWARWRSRPPRRLSLLRRFGGRETS